MVERIVGKGGLKGHHKLSPIAHGKRGDTMAADGHDCLAVDKVDRGGRVGIDVEGSCAQGRKFSAILPDAGIEVLGMCPAAQ